MSDQDSAAGGEVRGFERGLDHVDHTFDRFLAAADVDKVFGEPIRQGDTTIVPAAELITGMGFGFGFGRGSDSRRHEGGGGGGGGGGSVLARPVAVVVASPEGVRVEPVVDVTKVALAALTAGGFMLATWFGLARPKKPDFCQKTPAECVQGAPWGASR